MKKNRISNKTIALIAAAVLLFAGGTYTGTRAVLNVFSPEHLLEFETAQQNVTVLENGYAISKLLEESNGKIIPGKTNKEVISVQNTTEDASQFVRIVVRKYWKNAEGKKVTDIEEVDGKYPELDKIQLVFVNQDLWQLNSQESTAERQVYYYKNAVPAGGTTEPLTKTLTVDSSVASEYTIFGPDDGVYTYSYDYDGYQVCLEAEAQSIQTHNADDAIRSIWGVTNVTASGTTLTVE